MWQRKAQGLQAPVRQERGSPEQKQRTETPTNHMGHGSMAMPLNFDPEHADMCADIFQNLTFFEDLNTSKIISKTRPKSSVKCEHIDK
jgi:hypothetical protein